MRGVDLAAAPLRVRGVDLAAAPLRVRGVDLAAAPLRVMRDASASGVAERSGPKKVKIFIGRIKKSFPLKMDEDVLLKSRRL